MTQSKHYTDGKEIMVCRNLADVEKAFAAGAIAHLLSGEVKVEIAGSESVTLWVSDGANAAVIARDDAKATVRAFDKARASAWAHCNGKARVRVFEGTKVIVWAYDNADVTMSASGNTDMDVRVHDNAKATVWAYDDVKASVRAFNGATATVAAYNNAKANVEARGNADVAVRAIDKAKVITVTHGNGKANVAWLSSATPSPETATHITYKTATGEDADANIRDVAAFVKRERASFNMVTWHSDKRDLGGEFPCGTTHCMAGAAIFLKGDEGRKMEEMFGSQAAGAIILGKEAAKHFYTSDKNALIFLSSKLGEPIE